MPGRRNWLGNLRLAAAWSGTIWDTAAKEAVAQFLKIIDYNGMVWNCWTGALAQLGAARENALQAKNSSGADADLARTRALAAYKEFLTLWKDADPEIPIYQQAKVECASIQ